MPRKAQTQSIADLNAAPGGAAAVDRAISMLSAFQPGDESLTLAELSERTRLYKSTALRLLSSLEHARLVRRLPDGRYTLGNEIARLYGIYSSTFSLDGIVLPVLRKLVEDTGESAAYHVRQGEVRLCLYRVDSPQPIRDHVKAGEVLPLNQGTGGRVLTAFEKELFDAAPRSDKKLYKLIREQGYCASTGDRHAEVAGISAPVFHQDQTLAGALTLTMPAHRYDPRYIRQVTAAAREVSRQIP